MFFQLMRRTYDELAARVAFSFTQYLCCSAMWAAKRVIDGPGQECRMRELYGHTFGHELEAVRFLTPTRNVPGVHRTHGLRGSLLGLAPRLGLEITRKLD